MVLDDSIIANLDAEKLQKVLRPKVSGAENLDRLSRGMDLDYFVLFSSATTFVGNPGQGAYVAANAYLEGARAPPQVRGPAGAGARLGRHRQHRRARPQPRPDGSAVEPHRRQADRARYRASI